MLLPRACRMVLFGSVLTVLGGSLSEAQQKEPAGRAKVKSDPESRMPIRRASQEEDAPPKRPQKEARETRPDSKPLRIDPLPPELEKLLKDWEVSSAKITTLSGAHQRIVRNSVFEVEKWAEGEFFYESPDKGRIDLKGIEPKKGAKSSVKNAAGDPYRVEADQATKWICTGKSVLNIADKEKTYEMFELPQEMQGKNIIHGPLPFLFGMKAEEAKKRFELSFDDTKKKNKDVVWIKAKPRQVMDRDNFQEAQIQLDVNRFLPLAVKLIDPSGNVETVYIFPEDKLLVNKRELVPEIFRKDPFRPKLAGYKRIMPPDMPAQDPIQIAEPEGRRSKSDPAVRGAGGSDDDLQKKPQRTVNGPPAEKGAKGTGSRR